MFDDSVGDDDFQMGPVPLKEGIDLQSVLTGQSFEINFDENYNDDEGGYVPQEDDLAAFANVVLDFDSDDEDISSTQFERLALKMVNVTNDGKIKKLIKREGVGKTPPENAVVSILYSSYLEYSDEPTDYAYIKKPYQFRLGTAGIVGLNFAVNSMKVNEKSHFLIHPDYAFGTMGHPPRIPANATFFFQIELLRFSDSGPALKFEKLTLEEKSKFSVAHKTALGLMEKAKEHLKYNVKLAIRDYNRAFGLIDACQLKNIEEQETQQKLKVRILTNLIICYNKESLPKKACSMCNTIYAMSKNTSLIVPAKVYFNNGRALSMIGEYSRAKQKLLTAQRMEPQNQEISQELLSLNSKIEKAKRKEKELAKIYLQDNDKAVLEEVSVADDEDYVFRTTIINLCTDLCNSEDTQYNLPSGLTIKEREIAKMEAEKNGLKFKESKFNENGGKLTFCISKI